jgi:Grx4 family monothiol glutaredoxin
VQEITSDEAFTSFISAFPPSSLLVLYFHAPWAAPCKQMAAVLEALASTYPAQSSPSIAFLSLNAEELSDISEDHNVTAVPFVVLKKGGITLEEISGSNATKVREAVEKHATKPSPETQSIPPEQKITRPTEEREPAPLPATTVPATSTSTPTGVTRNLSAYVPTDSPAAAAESTEKVEVDKEALFKRLEQLVKAADVMLFMKGTPSAPQCGFSRKLVGLLRDRCIRYGFFNILADDDVRQGLKEFSEWPTFPQLYAEGELVGGLDIVSTMNNSLANNQLIICLGSRIIR